MIVKNTQDRNKITNSLPGLFDEKGEINDGELAKIKANVDKIAKLTVDNPDLVTDNEIDQAKIDDLKNGIKNILDIDSADPLPDTWKNDLVTKLADWKNRPTQEKLDKAVLDKENEYKVKIKWLINYFGKNVLEKVKIEAQIEVKEK